jgi:hypothetical protein
LIIAVFASSFYSLSDSFLSTAASWEILSIN